MPIAKKPIGNLKDITEKEVDTFIEGAGKRERKGKRVPILLRVAPDILEKIDAAAKRKGIPRTSWILYHIGGALEEEHDDAGKQGQCEPVICRIHFVPP